MANDIKTRPQGYQSPAFDNDEQRKEWEARALKVATIIYKQITAAPADVWQSWAMEHPAAIVWEGRTGLIFRVNGLQHRGSVIVTLDEGRDLYDVATLQEIDGDTVAVVVLNFSDADNFKRAQRFFDSDGPSQFCAGDWDENARTIEFVEGNDPERLAAALIEEMEREGITGYTWQAHRESLE